ncbi:MAG: short-chain fatty acid transporter [Elusimicrobia bacterium]|nr:short-chain fatty acid transporter [Elusimicrobiota bacterium]
MLSRLATRLTRFSEKIIPSAFTIACLLTLLTFLAARLLTPHSTSRLIIFWGDGFWTLLEFGMQICLIILTGYVVAVSPGVSRMLRALASLPRSPQGAVAVMALVSLTLSWLHWGLGLIAGAVLVLFMARRHPQADYRLLVACAYFGLGGVWHAGLSGSVPLLLATPNHFLMEQAGLIPLSQTLFTSFNLALTAITALALTLMAVRLSQGVRAPMPPPAHLVPSAAPSQRSGTFEAPAGRDELRVPAGPPEGSSVLDRSYWINALIGLLGIAWIFHYFFRSGGGLTLNSLNFLFLTAGIALHPSPASFLKAAEEGSRALHGVVIQFPLYAGMYGIIQNSGLAQTLAYFFIRISNAQTFPLVVYYYSAFLNYFVPSGGSKWAIEAPYLIEAAKSLGVPLPKMVLAYAWGDMLTNSIQPFWCIPLLAITRIEFKDILGYTALAFLTCGAIGTLAFLLFI